MTLVSLASGRGATASRFPSLLAQQPNHAGCPIEQRHRPGAITSTGLAFSAIATVVLCLTDEMDEVNNKKRKINHLEVGDAFNLANQSDAAPSSEGCELMEAEECIGSISSTITSLLELFKLNLPYY